MTRAALAALAVAGVAAADPAKPPASGVSGAPAAPAASAASAAGSADDAKPDPLAEAAADEANLESNAPRMGLTFSGAAGGSIGVGADDGVGRGGALSLRLGHVATPATIITFEVVAGSFLHSTGGTTLHNDHVSVVAGAQVYMTPGLWLRAAGGFGVYTKRELDMTTGATDATAYPGPAGLVGVGVDLFRRHYFVLGLEAFSVANIARDGLHTLSALCLGLSYY